jgi:uncharacterized protein
METQFGLVPPQQAGYVEDVLSVQVIALAQPSAPAGRTAQREMLSAVLAATVSRRVLAVDGSGDDGLPAGFDHLAQRGGGLGERMAGALADAYATMPLPMLLIRADTLGVSPEMIEDAARSLVSGEADAVLGLRYDGGFWLLGLRRPDRSLVVGIPEAGQEAGAGRLLLDRLATAGMRVALAPRVAGAIAKTVGELQLSQVNDLAGTLESSDSQESGRGRQAATGEDPQEVRQGQPQARV